MPDAGEPSNSSQGSISEEIQKAVSLAIPNIVQQVSAQLAQQLGNQPSEDQDDIDEEVAIRPRTNQTEDEELVQQSVEHALNDISKGSDDDDDDDGDDEFEFHFTLSEKELETVQKQKYLDFTAVYRRVMKKAGGPKISIAFTDTKVDFDASQDSRMATELSISEWVHIFLAFQSAHVRAFPDDATHLPKYMECILEMHEESMDWRHYDEAFRRLRAKKAQKGVKPKRLKKWYQTDVQLYVQCGKTSKKNNQTSLAKKSTPPATVTTTASQSPMAATGSRDGIPKLPRTCWRYQTATCDGACYWPDTHHCYNCQGDHPTRDCGQQDMVTHGGNRPRQPPVTDLRRDRPFRASPRRERRGRARSRSHSRTRERRHSH